ncbi:flavin containing amine oxidase, putative [Talaromyces stipitatus ATCC 10500]|uniref:Flavin containing amine oxidase, putative n=1 Tax=Talaromyces stipitatus (strain ATCC 10500 / CBS 375.48 / QM 6759 / NRRL 1006) TaxID=441959 RepID=B8MQD0_TALSN|nr:flavin containing amine oxidase, putative [Talaromyces stipitatus ATCC 10500]EED13332.1 flavin containing amine oxidase, putative [Talaromyces stipitatus ATCC 10500]
MFKQGKAPPREISIDKAGDFLERVAQSFFTVDGHSSRKLMPYPHDPFKRPALCMKYSHLSVKDRLDNLHEFSDWEKNFFESNTNTFGSALGKDTAFTGALRWYALGGNSMAGLFEMAVFYKIENGCMTSFARAILGDYKGDMLFGAPIKDVTQNKLGVRVTTKSGQDIKARYVVSTIPFINCLGDVKFDNPVSPIRQSAIRKGHINKGAKIHFRLKATEPGYGHLGDKENHRQIIDHFRKDIHPSAAVEAYVTHDWTNDPYTKGGADWEVGWRGFVDGAIEQGHQAPQSVVAALKLELRPKLIQMDTWLWGSQ